MNCPKCGRESKAQSVICKGCDYILDVSFLGDDILNEDNNPDEDEDGLPPPPMDSDFGGDALILGDVDDHSEHFDAFESEKTGDFLTAATSAGMRRMQPASVYIDAKTQALLDPEVIPRVKPETNLSALHLSPFEMHLIDLIDGERPVARIQTLAGLSVDDFRIGIALVADKGLLDIAGRAASSAQPAYNPALDDATLADPELGESDLASSDISELPVDTPAATPLDLPLNALAPVESPPAAAAPLAPVGPKVSAADQAKAKQMYLMATRDIIENRLARARTYAAMAAKLDPATPAYQFLIDNWADAKRIANESDGAPAEVRLFNEARIAERAGDYQKTVTLLKEAIQHKPDAAQLHNQLGVVLATRLHMYTDALNALFCAVELDSKNKSYKNNLGKVLAMSEGGAPGSATSGGGPTAGSMLSRFKKKLF